MKKNLKQAINEAVQYLSHRGIADASIDGEYLLLHLLQYDRVKLYTSLDEEISVSQYKAYRELIEKRGAGMPTQYIIGKQEFMGLRFIVSPEVLIPRQDTETLVETILEEIPAAKEKLILDIGTGTGCIPISVCHFRKEMKGIGIDISEEALKIADENGVHNGVEDRIRWVKSNLFHQVPRKQFDYIVSNPPYIPSGDIENLMCEVKEYEPKRALDGGPDGLDFYRIISREAKKFLNQTGTVFYEVGYNQADMVSKILEEEGYLQIRQVKDLTGIQRVVYGKL